MRARVGVLEDVRRSAGGGLESVQGDELLGSGLSAAKHHEDALSVKEAELSTLRRLGGSEDNILITQGNLANSYQGLGRHLEKTLRTRQEVYSGRLRLDGEEHRETLKTAINYAISLSTIQRYEEAMALLRKPIRIARRVLGDNDEITITMKMTYAEALYKDTSATLDNLLESVKTLEETGQTARRVLGSSHPTAEFIAGYLQNARAALRAREASARLKALAL